jgi:hypothetical protein
MSVGSPPPGRSRRQNVPAGRLLCASLPRIRQDMEPASLDQSENASLGAGLARGWFAC